jgi:hypothetical protein
VFLQNYQGRWIFRINELFFYWKIGGIAPRSIDRVHDGRSTETSLNQDHPSGDLRLELNEPKGYFTFYSWPSVRVWTGRIRLGRERRQSDQAEQRRAMAASRAHRSLPLNTPGLDDVGFLVQNGAEGKGILTRGSLTAGWVPRWLAAVGTLLHSFGSARGASKASPVLKLDVERRWLLLKFVDTFNCGELRRKSMHNSGD